MGEGEVYQRLRDAEVLLGRVETRLTAAESQHAQSQKRVERMGTQLTRIEEHMGVVDQIAADVRGLAQQIGGEDGMGTRLKMLEEGRKGASKFGWMALGTVFAAAIGWIVRKLGS